MTETKPWWLSRTIWMGLATALMAVFSAAGVMPIWLDEMFVSEVITALLGLATVYFRSKAVKEIQPVINT